MQDNDEILVGKMLAGQESALAELFRRHQKSIYRFVLHMGGSHSMSEDITQEVFVTLIGRGSDFDAARGTVGAFLFGIARNHVLRRLRAGRKVVSMEEGTEERGAPGNQLEDLSRQETVETVRRMILALPPKYREAVVLCDLHELDYATAGAVMGCRTGTVRSRLHRGREMLQRKLEARYRSREETHAEAHMNYPHFDREAQLQDALRRLAESTAQEQAPDRVREAVLNALRNRPAPLSRSAKSRPALWLAWAAAVAIAVPAAAYLWGEAQLQPVPPVQVTWQQDAQAEAPPVEPVRFAERKAAPADHWKEHEPDIAVTDFLALDYTGPVSSSYQIVRVRMNRASLAQYGLPVNPERTGPLDADVLIGEDGIPRAVRFVNNITPASYRP